MSYWVRRENRTAPEYPTRIKDLLSYDYELIKPIGYEQLCNIIALVPEMIIFCNKAKEDLVFNNTVNQ